MSKILVVDTNKTPLNPIYPGRARILFQEGKAAVWKRYPFTIILKDVLPNPQLAPRLKIDPRAKLTGLALVNESTSEVVWTAELEPRGFQIRDALTKRCQLRRGRCNNPKTRYGQPRFDNRKRPTGSLSPRLQRRVENRVTWVIRLQKLASISSDISQELVKFDTQLTLVNLPSKNPVI
ncbi:RRXRR domain-containing protein [Microcoleus sp. herbarium2]|uniref:RRXRR domain-containing protein n=1 Tax=Microcoleus sp. herbarium2 TaxID=3055433 RepID=UPI002FD34069